MAPTCMTLASAAPSSQSSTPTVCPSVSPAKAADLWRTGRAILVDVRETDEYRQVHVPGSALCPTSVCGPSDVPAAPAGGAALILCRSGARAGRMAAGLMAEGRTDALVVEGGIQAWQAAGLPVAKNARAPMPIFRQVFVIVGAMLVVVSVLAATVSPWWVLGTGLLGGALFFAGATGICGLAMLLAHAPWNKIAKGASAGSSSAKTTMKGSACAGSCCSEGP